MTPQTKDLHGFFILPGVCETVSKRFDDRRKNTRTIQRGEFVTTLFRIDGDSEAQLKLVDCPIAPVPSLTFSGRKISHTRMLRRKGVTKHRVFEVLVDSNDSKSDSAASKT